MHLLHLVTTISTEYRERAEEQEAGAEYTPLCTQRLQDWLPNYNEYLAYATATKLLETDNHFKRAKGAEQGKCRGYRFAALYRQKAHLTKGPQVQLVHLQNPKFVRQLDKHRFKQARTNLLHWGNYRHLLRWIDPQTTPLRIHETQACAFLQVQLEQAWNNPQQRKRKRERYAQERVRYKDPDQQYRQGLASIIKLADQEIGGHVDETAGRLHTTLTNMSGALRKFVYAEGYGPLVAIDLKNSQPYLATLLLNPKFYEKEREFPKEFPNPRQKKRKGRERKLIPRNPKYLSSLTLSKILKRADCEEFDKFRKWTSNGTFYDEMVRELNAQAESRPSASALFDRDGIKKMLFEVLFSPNSKRSPSADKAAFGKLFPTVTQVFWQFKAQDHTVLPCLLQILEAHLFLHIITKRIHQEKPEVPLFTVHDSVVVPAEFADYVEYVMQEELTRWVGLPATFTRTAWGCAPEEPS